MSDSISTIETTEKQEILLSPPIVLDVENVFLSGVALEKELVQIEGGESFGQADRWQRKYGRLSPEAKEKLEKQMGGEIARVHSETGANSKDAFVCRKTGKIAMVVKSKPGDGTYEQTMTQIKAYEQYSSDPDFQDVFAPMTRLIVGKNGETVGMEQQYRGIELDRYMRQGGRLTLDQIDDFINRYKNFIEKRGVVHDEVSAVELIKNPKTGVEELSVRVFLNDVIINPEDGKLYFIDFYGKKGLVKFKKEWYSQDSQGRIGDLTIYEYFRRNQPTWIRDRLINVYGDEQVQTSLKSVGQTSKPFWARFLKRVA